MNREKMRGQDPKISSIARELSLATADSLSVAMETNGRGFHGFIVELPGAYVRGPLEEEALYKAPSEAKSYLSWLGQERGRFPKARTIQTHLCQLMVEDADCEIILDEDRQPMTNREFRQLVELAKYSGLTFTKLYDSVELRDWIDASRVRTTFHGPNMKTIQEIFSHVKRTQYYYLSRIGIPFIEDKADSFMKIRNLSLDSLAARFRENGNSKVHTVDNEIWTLKKVLRRFIWHDRIHGKAVTRMLEKQRQLGLIDKYEDLFLFKIGSNTH